MKEIIHNLREKGVVLTHQRLAVLSFLTEHHQGHPTATEIYRQLRKDYPTISQATVYSTLEFLKKMGQVRELYIRPDQACFDHVEKPHHHLFCRRCRRVVDVNIPCPSLEETILEGHRVEEVQLFLYGICSRCRQELKDAGHPEADG